MKILLDLNGSTLKATKSKGKKVGGKERRKERRKERKNKKIQMLPNKHKNTST